MRKTTAKALSDCSTVTIINLHQRKKTILYAESEFNRSEPETKMRGSEGSFQ